MDFQELYEEGKTALKRGRYNHAVELFTKALDSAHGAADEEQEEKCSVELARSLRHLSLHDEALKHIERARQLAIKSSGEESLPYATVLNELGYIYTEQFLFKEAEAALSRALELRRMCEADPSDVSEVLHNLGMFHWRKGDDRSSMQHYEEALAIRKDIFGEMNEDFAETLDNIGVIYQRINSLDRAEANHRRALEIREKCLGPDHPDVGYSVLNLAEVLLRRGQSDKYLEMAGKTIAIWEKALGENSLDVSGVISNVGVYHLNSGNLQEAASCFERSLRIKERVLGSDSPRLTVTLYNLGMAYRHLKRVEEADALETRAEKMMLEKFEAEGEKDIETVIMLADKWHHSGRRKEASELVDRAMKVASSEFGESSLKVARLLHFQGALVFEHNPEQAKELFAAVLRIEKKEYGKRDPKLAETLRLLGNCFAIQGDNQTAQVLNAQARAIEFAAGIEDPEEKLYRMMLTKREQLHGQKDATVVQTKKMLAEFFRMQGREEEADALNQEYLEALKEQAGEFSIDYADELFMAGMMDAGRNQHDRALEKFYRSLKIQESLPSLDERDLLLTLDSISLSEEAADQIDKASDTIKRAVALRERLYGDNHWSLKGGLERLHKLAEKRGDERECHSLRSRMESLPEPTALEQSELMNLHGDRITRMMNRAFEGLGAMLQLFAQEGEQSQTGT